MPAPFFVRRDVPMVLSAWWSPALHGLLGLGWRGSFPRLDSWLLNSRPLSIGRKWACGMLDVGPNDRRCLGYSRTSGGKRLLPAWFTRCPPFWARCQFLRCTAVLWL